MQLGVEFPEKPRSFLSYHFEKATENSNQVVIAIHDYDSTAEKVTGFARNLFPNACIYSPEASRVIGYYPGAMDQRMAQLGKAWFIGEDPIEVEPLTFGEAVQQLELFLLETIRNNQADERPEIILLGEGQGAMLALALTLLQGKQLSALISVNGVLPDIELKDWVETEYADESMDLSAFLFYEGVQYRSLAERISATDALLKKNGIQPDIQSVQTLDSISVSQRLQPLFD